MPLKNFRNLLPEKGPKRLLFFAALTFVSLSLLLIAIFFLPLVISSVLAWYGSKKIESKNLRLAAVSIIVLIALFLNIQWLSVFGEVFNSKSPSETSTLGTTQTAEIPTLIEVSPIPTFLPTATNLPAPTSTPIPQFFEVVKVVDGDTIVVNLNGVNETLRLIGIDTPETVDPRKPVQCFGQEASDKAHSLLDGQKVRLEADPSQGERDKYNRLLRYVFLENGTHFNKLMVSEGYAFEYTYNLPYKYQDEFQQAENEAREGKRGLWADEACAGNPTLPTNTPQPQTVTSVPAPTTAPTTYTPPTPASQAGSTCDCSGNLYNCDDFKTHAEAQACFEYCGGINNDVHRLDNDKDGVACESLP